MLARVCRSALVASSTYTLPKHLPPVQVRGFWDKLKWPGQDKDKEMELKKMEMELELKKLALEQKKLEDQEKERKERREESENQQIREEKRAKDEQQILEKPKNALVQQAQKQVAHQQESDALLNKLETSGFSFHSMPVVFVVDNHKTEEACLQALDQIPKGTAEKVARLMAITEESSSMKTIYHHSNGRGEISTVNFKVTQTGGKKSVALLVYGASFEAANVLERVEKVTREVPIFKDVPVQILAEEGIFGSRTYRTAYRTQQVGTERITEEKPIFKEKVLTVQQQREMMESLETQACRLVLKHVA